MEELIKEEEMEFPEKDTRRGKRRKKNAAKMLRKFKLHVDIRRGNKFPTGVEEPMGDLHSKLKCLHSYDKGKISCSCKKCQANSYEHQNKRLRTYTMSDIRKDDAAKDRLKEYREGRAS